MLEFAGLACLNYVFGSIALSIQNGEPDGKHERNSVAKSVATILNPSKDCPSVVRCSIQLSYGREI